jgi:hypothetical protein
MKRSQLFSKDTRNKEPQAELITQAEFRRLENAKALGK